MIRHAAVAILLASSINTSASAQDPGKEASDKFDALDKNGDGKLTPEEFPRKKYFAAADKNADGAITFEEVKAYLSGKKRKTGAKEKLPSGAVKTYRNLVYARHPGHKDRLTSLDIYAPRRGKNHPIMIFIHGGGWRRGDKGSKRTKPEHFVRAGYVYVTINYRLIPKIKYPENIQDVADAVSWIHDHARKYGGDPDMIFVSGHSAGAHLAALVATDGRRLAKAGKDLSIIKGAVLLDVGAYDLTKAMPQMIKNKVGVYVRAFGTEPGLWKDASPVHHVARGREIPPVFIVYAALRSRTRRQSEMLLEVLKQADVPAKLHSAKDRNHGTLNSRFGTKGDPTTKAAMKFLEEIKNGEHR